jgi:expansin (peptidoglycan-binding protein)
MCFKVLSSAATMTVHNPKDTETIAQLTAENERLLRVVEQATKRMEVYQANEEDGAWILLCNMDGNHFVAYQTQAPDLYAQLKGVDRG